MTSRGNWDRETGSLLMRIDIPDLSDQLDGVRATICRSWQVPSGASRTADGATLEHPRHRGRDVGVGLLIGYLIRRGTD